MATLDQMQHVKFWSVNRTLFQNGNLTSFVQNIQFWPGEALGCSRLSTCEISSPVRVFSAGGIPPAMRATSPVAPLSPTNTISSVLANGADTSAAIYKRFCWSGESSEFSSTQQRKSWLTKVMGKVVNPKVSEVSSRNSINNSEILKEDFKDFIIVGK